MQKTNFEFEVLVGDDCSTDGTSEIVSQYSKKYPDIIKHIRRQQNMGCLANFMDLCEKASAKYVAFCDGDDYWTDENKLQKQYDFMEKNEDVNICAHKVLVKCQENCSNFLYYANLKEPFILPSKQKFNKKLTINNIIMDLPQMSSLFIRWQNIKFPDWCFKGILGDFTVACLNLGNKYAYILNETMSIYRKTDSGVDFHKGSLYQHFLETRKQHFHICTNLIEYFRENYNSFNIYGIESRLWTEIINYTDAIIKTDRWDKLNELKEEYPDIYKKTKALLSEYKYRVQQIRVLDKKNADLLRKDTTLKLIKPVLEGSNTTSTPNINLFCKKSNLFKKAEKTFLNILSFSAYWFFALIPKKKNLWVFSGFFRKNYMDNTKYLYEYIVKNHPEIKAVWLTGSKEIKNKLQKENLPVLKMNSIKGILTMIRAQIAFSDHFKMSDYKNIYGYNAGTKFVNLWHGVGPKGMVPQNDNIPNTTIPGVKLSSDIIIQKNDKFLTKFLKILKYPFIAPFRELFENYYGILCPGEPFVKYFANPWNTRKTAQIMSGYPRNSASYLKNTTNREYKIIYAPTYRWNQKDEKVMIKDFLKNVPEINNFLKEHDCKFVLRLHPHTWRNYNNDILKTIKNYKLFSIDTEKDIYKSLQDYSIMITDYSSIGYDFLIGLKPVIYLAFDYETYGNTDCPFSMDYKKVCAGEITKNWQETLDLIKKYYKNPNMNIELRKRILEEFFPSAYNNENNSYRIVEKLKESCCVK